MQDIAAIRRARAEDRAELLRMRLALWPDSTEADMDEALARQAAPEILRRLAIFVAARKSGGLGGFVEAGFRAYAEGCETSPVGFVEGWLVDPDLRRKGVGRALVAAAEGWAAGQGAREMGSDAALDNETSIAAHRALGFALVERVVCFAKKL